MSIFDSVAPIYGLFFNFQIKYFNKIQARASKEINLDEYASILDIGCGTGALCKTLDDKGLKVTGVDPSEGMLKQAKKKLAATDVDLFKMIPRDRLPFDDNSFDVAITSYVAHGLKPDERIKLYKEMRRVSKDIVIIHDYNSERALLTTIIEWLERGDYFNFIKIAKEQMTDVFGKTVEINVDTRASWYICYCGEKSKKDK